MGVQISVFPVTLGTDVTSLSCAVGATLIHNAEARFLELINSCLLMYIGSKN